jgi:peptidoglycan L-alanyl-D-glutamate endopeptidase CwlK
MPFVLGKKSENELEGVEPRLVAVVKEAIGRSPVDFMVHDGLRTALEQKRLVASGASWTMNSKHLPQSDGFGHAVDLVPYINGKLRWEWVPIYSIAEAMRTVAREQGLRIVWGGVWDRCLNDLEGRLDLAVKEYCERHPGPDKIDGPHYQLA